MGELTVEGHRTPRNVKRQTRERCGRSQKVVEGKGRIGLEERDHRRSWNPMEGRGDSVRTLGNLIEH